MTPHIPFFLCILSFLYPVFADPVNIPLLKRSTAKRSFSDIVAEAQRVQRKYYGNPKDLRARRASKRAGVAGVQIIDQACAPPPFQSFIFNFCYRGKTLLI